MKSADSGAVSSEDSIVLHMLDWWLSNNAFIMSSVIASATPRGCASFSVSEVGRCILEQWDAWETTVLGDLRGNPLGAYMWKATENGWLRKEPLEGEWSGSWQYEFACRVGTMAKEGDWTVKHRREITKNQRAIRAIKKVQEI